LAIDDEASGSDTGVEWNLNGREANSIKNGDGKAKAKWKGEVAVWIKEGVIRYRREDEKSEMRTTLTSTT
jgi:hypothetical protein